MCVKTVGFLGIIPKPTAVLNYEYFVLVVNAVLIQIS